MLLVDGRFIPFVICSTMIGMILLLPFLILVDSTTSTSSDEGSSNGRSTSTSSSRSGSPNFIVFFVDDLGYGYVNLYMVHQVDVS